MLKIEFLYWEGCPSHERSLVLLRESMQRLSINVSLEMICVETEEQAHQHHFFGSPTIRVNGLDIAALPSDIPAPGLNCRAYRRADGRISPLPPVELIEAALKTASVSSSYVELVERKDATHGQSTPR